MRCAPVLQVVEDMAVLCSRSGGFEVEDEPITCAVLEGGPCSACKEMVAFRRQIKQLEEELAKLKAKRNTILTKMNTIHDPLIHKLPPEIGSQIFRFCLPLPLDFEGFSSWGARDELKPALLRLGAVCRNWRQLAWTTPDLWENISFSIRPSTIRSRSLAESPGFLREWLDRSGGLPLNIFFVHYFDYGEYTSSEDDSSSNSVGCGTSDNPRATIDMVEIATGLAIEILNSHSGRWRNLHITADAEIFGRFSWHTQPNQLVGLELWLTDESQPQNFMIDSEFTPTHLKLDSFPLTSINICWDKTTHITLCHISTEECIDILGRTPHLEYYNISRLYSYDTGEISSERPMLHSRLRSLHLSKIHPCHIEEFLGAINLPFLEEWTQDVANYDYGYPVEATVSFVKRSMCCLKILILESLDDELDLNTLLQAIPSLERIHLSFETEIDVSAMMDDILARIFRQVPASGSILVEGHTAESFLPHLQFMECSTVWRDPIFSWDRIPQLYRQGHRRSLVLKTTVEKSDISDETALQFLQLADEGLNLQIFDISVGGYFLENFRKRMCEQGV